MISVAMWMAACAPGHLGGVPGEPGGAGKGCVTSPMAAELPKGSAARLRSHPGSVLPPLESAAEDGLSPSGSLPGEERTDV